MLNTVSDINRNITAWSLLFAASSASSNFITPGTHQVDLARKLQEDPLFDIKKKEIECRSQILNNPVKLKKLKQFVSYTSL